MKLTIKRDDLINALLIAKMAISGRPIMPALSCALFEATEGALSIRATNMEQWTFADAVADVKESGSVVISADKLLSIAQRSSADEISISVDSKHVAKIDGKSIKATIPGLPESDFAKTPDIESVVGWTMECGAKELDVAIGRVICAISSDSGRPTLQGIHLASREGSLLAEATDGRRAHRAFTGLACKDTDAIIPTGALKIMRELLSIGGEAKISINENRILVRCGRFAMTSKLIEGIYPNVSQVVSFDRIPVFSANRRDLIKAIEDVSVMADQDTIAAKIEAAKDGGILISMESKNSGKCSTAMASENIDHEIVINANNAFLRDALKAATSDIVTISIGTGEDGKPSSCMPIVFADEKFTAVVMPIQVV